MTPFILVSCLSVAESVNRSADADTAGTSGDPGRTLRLATRLTCVIGERPAVLVEDEPALLPGLYLAPHLDEEAPAGFIGDGQMEAGVWVVSSCLDVAVEIKVVLPHWEVAA